MKHHLSSSFYMNDYPNFLLLFFHCFLGWNDINRWEKLLLVLKDVCFVYLDSNSHLRSLLCRCIVWHSSNVWTLQQLSYRDVFCILFDSCVILLYYCLLHQILGKSSMVQGFLLPLDIWVSCVNFEFGICFKGSFVNRDNVRRHIVRCWNAMFAGRELPDLPPEEDKFNKKVSFFEATTESISQFTLSSVIFRIFGISDSFITKFFQYFSIATSSLSLTTAFISVSER